ncbi:hypothetical protein ACFQL8_19385 [Streptomyces goshikiensis]|uniref:hypothetical protein n=1 Tax=Streptomyces goshikiensis TaxID=1942 RepID=UPI001675C517|nr:hypothetical protein [Streptomyces goshikiensis]GHD79430.1 hypothetical protein GCM10010336_61460 [Streptomyces goshikiensis]
MTGYDTLTFSRQTAERIVTDLSRDTCGLSGFWDGDALTFIATQDYDGEGFTYTATPDAQGRYTIEALWPWDVWDEDHVPSEVSRAYAHGALTTSEPMDPAYSDAAAAAWRSGRTEAARLLHTTPTAQAPLRAGKLPPTPHPATPPSARASPGNVR